MFEERKCNYVLVTRPPPDITNKAHKARKADDLRARTIIRITVSSDIGGLSAKFKTAAEMVAALGDGMEPKTRAQQQKLLHALATFKILPGEHVEAFFLRFENLVRRIDSMSNEPMSSVSAGTFLPYGIYGTSINDKMAAVPRFTGLEEVMDAIRDAADRAVVRAPIASSTASTDSAYAAKAPAPKEKCPHCKKTNHTGVNC